MRASTPDYREKAFHTKFENAARRLGVSPQQVVSLKLREVVQSYEDYDRLREVLEMEAGIHSDPLPDDLQGEGALLTSGKTKAIVVRHETGLEILYIAGSIASLVSLIPLILQGWTGIRGWVGRSHHRGVESVEVRRLDAQGCLVEDRAHGVLGLWTTPFGIVDTALKAAAEIIDGQMLAVREEIRQLSARVEGLEATVAASTAHPVRKKARPTKRAKA